MPPTRSPLKLETRLDVLLALLGASTRPVRGITRLVKLLFLAEKEVDADRWLKRGEYYGYRPYKIGPFSADVYEDVEILQDSGLIEGTPGHAEAEDDIAAWEEEYATDVTPEPGPDSVHREVNRAFRLTGDGLKCAEAILSSVTNEQRTALRQLRARYDRMSLRQLLVYVYTRYPKYAEESEIRGDLGLE